MATTIGVRAFREHGLGGKGWGSAQPLQDGRQEVLEVGQEAVIVVGELLRRARGRGR